MIPQPLQKKSKSPKEDSEKSESLGKSMAPPPFALKAQADSGAAPVQKKDDGKAPIQKQDAGGEAESAAAVAAPSVIDTTAQATWHYFNGGGKSVDIGPNTINSLLTSDKFLEKHARITGGLTSSLTGNFSVDMTWRVFHIGRTNVDYEVVVNGDQCTVNYTLFVDDGYWDVDELDEAVLGGIGLPWFQPDGMGPNLERGGDPYHYNTSSKSYTFDNPGY